MILLVAGYWLLVAGCWLLVAGCWLLVDLRMKNFAIKNMKFSLKI